MQLKDYFLIAVLSLFPVSVFAQPGRAPERGQYAYLEIMHEQQSPDLCLPTCVAMAMNYYGDGKSQYTLKNLSHEHRDIFSGTSFEDIQNGIKTIGYTWDRWQWPGDSIGFSNALNAVEQSLDDGKPVILEIEVQFFSGTSDWVNEPSLGPKLARKAGHALLAFGYDNREKEIFVMDPAMPFPGKRHIPFDELRKMWRYFDGRFHGLFTAKAGDLPDGHVSSAQRRQYVNH